MEENKFPKHSERNIKSIKVAILCIIAIVILYFGSVFLKGFDVFSKKNYYYSIYDNSGGLHSGAVVYLQGFPIGKVAKVKLFSNNPVRILAEYLINEDVKFPIDSRFEITSKGMMGGIAVRLNPGKKSEFAHSGDTLDCGIVPQFTDGLESMKSQIMEILASVDTITVSLKDVLSHRSGAEKLAQTLNNIESITASLDKMIEENKINFGKMVTEITKFSETLGEASPDLKRIIANFDRISDSLTKANIAEVIVNVNNTVLQIEEIAKKINSGDGNASKLLNDNDLYIKLGNLTQSLDDLLIDIRQNPKKYINVTIFGKKETKK